MSHALITCFAAILFVVANFSDVAKNSGATAADIAMVGSLILMVMVIFDLKDKK